MTANELKFVAALKKIATRSEGCDVTTEEFLICKTACDALGWKVSRDAADEVVIEKKEIV